MIDSFAEIQFIMVNYKVGEYSPSKVRELGGTMRDDNDLHAAFNNAEDALTQTDAPNAHNYLKDLKGEGYDALSEAEKNELLESLFIIMKSFVNLGYGFDPVNKLISEFESSSKEPIPVIDLEDAKDEE